MLLGTINVELNFSFFVVLIYKELGRKLKNFLFLHKEEFFILCMGAWPWCLQGLIYDVCCKVKGV